MVRRALTAVVAVVLFALACCVAASAHVLSAADLGGGGPDGVPAVVERALGGKVTALDNGLYKVRAGDGFSYTTHGPDFAADLGVDSHGATIELGDPERDIACATDYYQEILYGYPSTGTNQLATYKADIQRIIKVINAVLNEESLASGGPQADYKVLCEPDGSIKVTAFPVTWTGHPNPTFTEIIDSAKAEIAATDQNVDYSIFYDGPSAGCGTGTIKLDDTPGVNNENNNPGGAITAGYSAAYITPGKNCWFTNTPMHENAHAQGAVQPAAPNSTGLGGFHCNQEDDVMCYVDGGPQNQTMVSCTTNPGTIHYDCGWDSYFDSNPEPGEYLASHWNIGSSVNRFIRFGGPDLTPPETSITDGPTGTIATTGTSFSFSSPEVGATFECRLDGGAYSPCSSPKALSGLSEGGHTFYVRAKDPSGNADATPASRSFTVDLPGGGPAPPADTTPPATTIDSGSSKVKKGKNATFSFSSSEMGATFECQTDGDGYATCSSPTVITKPRKGSHTFQVRSTDTAGNVGAAASKKFTVKKKKKKRRR